MMDLEFRDVTVRYGRGARALVAVDSVSLVVPHGGIVGLVGESGSGKTTLAKAAAGLAPITSGSVIVAGRPVPRRHRMGRSSPVQMVFQDPYSSLDPMMTVGRTVAEGLGRGLGLARSAKRAEVARLLELVQLESAMASRHPAELSGGQRQRVALARALAGRPSVVIADEITSALDVSVQGAVVNLVRDIVNQLAMSVLFISHNLAVVRHISDVIAVMYLGRIVELGTTDDLLADPQHPYTRSLLEATPVLRACDRRASENAVPDAVRDQEPPNPHFPPHGCRYHTRCISGPAVNPSRSVCLTQDPSEVAPGRRHSAACHFAEPRNP